MRQEYETPKIELLNVEFFDTAVSGEGDDSEMPILPW